MFVQTLIIISFTNDGVFMSLKNCILYIKGVPRTPLTI